MQRSNHRVIDVFRDVAERNRDRKAFLFEDGAYTFRQLDEFSNRVSHYFHSLGLRKGDVVALFMESRPAYVGIWLGLAKIGVIPALINFNLRQQPLVHCVVVANCRAVICGLELLPAIRDVSQQLNDHWRGGREHDGDGGAALHLHAEAAPIFIADFNSPVPADSSAAALEEAADLFGAANMLDVSLGAQPAGPIEFYRNKASRGAVSMKDPFLLIYTSGTTGLPKAAIINQARFYTMARAVTLMFSVRPDRDVIYNCLPLYHTAGGMLGVGQVIVSGVTVALRRRFSASRFWADVCAHDCTVVQYIGEICRYLLAQPPRPEERRHRVRLGFGNGVRPQTWVEFQTRFGVRQIGEFYGATESNANVVNFVNKVGAVGFTTRLVPCLHPIALIRIDQETGEPIRDPSTGLCQRCRVGEPGEMIGSIVDADPTLQFDGYVSRDDTSKKVLFNVFHKGDRAFRSGDVLVMDELGFLFFRDRLGDTFRWKGENVSTAEVEGLVARCLRSQHDVVVYGVEVPHCEGRAGMACIQVDPGEKAEGTEGEEGSGDAAEERNHAPRDIDLDQLLRDMRTCLAPYAMPLFLRLSKQIEGTGTFKLKKNHLIKAGFNPPAAISSSGEGASTSDRLYYLDQTQGAYMPLTTSCYNRIVDGLIKF